MNLTRILALGDSYTIFNVELNRIGATGMGFALNSQNCLEKLIMGGQAQLDGLLAELGQQPNGWVGRRRR